MRDSVEFLFRQRFRGHEAPVDPAMWEAIQGKLAASTPQADTDQLEDLMRERFQGHEVPVDPALWGNISAQLGHSAAVGSAAGGGFSSGFGWAAAGVGAVMLAGAAYLLWPEAPPTAQASITEQRGTPSTAEEVVVMPPGQDPIAADDTPVQGSTAVQDGPRTNTPPPAMAPVEANDSHVLAQASEGSSADTDGTAPSPMTSVQPTPMEGSNGSELVERIIEDVTTRVKEEVLARTATPPDPAQPASDEQAWEPEELPEGVELLEPLMPNVFTPNGDGVNDSFKVINAHLFSRMVIKVFAVKNDRMVFSTTSNEPWNGDNCEDGYYLVAVEAMTPEGRIVTKGQVVWLNREIRH